MSSHREITRRGSWQAGQLRNDPADNVVQSRVGFVEFN
jgi:hypothetical protein